MPQRKHKILNRNTAETAKSFSAVKHAAKGVPPLPFATAEDKIKYIPPPPKTPLDDLFNLIYDKCVWGYRFTDNYYGMPWIEKKDIEDKGNGIYVIHFRSPVEYAHESCFGSMAKEVCTSLNCKLHVFHKIKKEVYFGKIQLEYEDYVWVIQLGELDTNTTECLEPSAAKDFRESEEVDLTARMLECLENFV